MAPASIPNSKGAASSPTRQEDGKIGGDESAFSSPCPAFRRPQPVPPPPPIARNAPGKGESCALVSSSSLGKERSPEKKNSKREEGEDEWKRKKREGASADADAAPPSSDSSASSDSDSRRAMSSRRKRRRRFNAEERSEEDSGEDTHEEDEKERSRVERGEVVCAARKERRKDFTDDSRKESENESSFGIKRERTREDEDEETEEEEDVHGSAMQGDEEKERFFTEGTRRTETKTRDRSSPRSPSLPSEAGGRREITDRDIAPPSPSMSSAFLSPFSAERGHSDRRATSSSRRFPAKNPFPEMLVALPGGEGGLHRVKTELRLDQFLSRYMSEDSKSFWEIVKKEKREKEERQRWIGDTQERHNARMVEIQKKTVEGEHANGELAVGFLATRSNLFYSNFDTVAPHKQPYEYVSYTTYTRIHAGEGRAVLSREGGREAVRTQETRVVYRLLQPYVAVHAADHI